MNDSDLALSDVLYWFSLEQAKPTAALVDEYRQRFPQYADAIVEFAVDSAFDALRPLPADYGAEDVVQQPSDAVMTAISHFQNARYEAAGKRDTAESVSGTREAGAVNPFGTLRANDFKRLAKDLDVTTLLIVKLRDRQILAETIPSVFTQSLASHMNVPVDLLCMHLSRRPTLANQGVFFKATDKPPIQSQETFEEALLTSGLTSEQQQRLLRL